MAIENHQKVAFGPLVIKAAKGPNSNSGREKEVQMSSKLFLLRLQPNSKYLKI